MTREEAKELLPMIKAFADGKEIQYRNSFNEWIDIKKNERLSFIKTPLDYRIKPEQKYRPFKSQEECWQEMHKHPDFGWVKGNATGEYKQVICISGYKTELIFNVFYGSPAYHSSKMMFSSYTFTDGTPFGIKEKQLWKILKIL